MRIDANDSGHANGLDDRAFLHEHLHWHHRVRNSAPIVRDAANLSPATVVFNGTGMPLIGGDLDPGSGADFTPAVGSAGMEIRWTAAAASGRSAAIGASSSSGTAVNWLGTW